MRYLPFKLEGLNSDGGLRNIRSGQERSMARRSNCGTDDHILFTFILTPNTVYCRAT